MTEEKCIRQDLIDAGSLVDRVQIGSGGFGIIYKARHKDWAIPVAVKELYGPSSNDVLSEARLMCEGSCQFVLRLLGVCQSPVPQGSWRLGLVMQFMENGSLEALLERLSHLPWPLTFRLAHQVALGMNFLHLRSPVLLHLDLKPSNVLLDDSFNAQLTDFGLAKLMSSVSSVSRESQGGTISYMPPEAIEDVNYKPTPAYDVFSFGILLWSLITGEKPYSHAKSSLIKWHIPRGQRPDISHIDSTAVEKLGDMMKLMQSCWDRDQNNRPLFSDCILITEKVYEHYRPGILDAIHRVQDILSKMPTRESMDSLSKEISNLRVKSDQQSPAGVPLDKHIPVHQATGPGPQQETSGSVRSKNIKPEHHPPPPMRMHSAESRTQTTNQQYAYCQETSESVRSKNIKPEHHPPPPMRMHSAEARTQTTNQQYAFYQNPFSPPAFKPQDWYMGQPLSQSQPVIHFTASNVSGLQVGHNNVMHITKTTDKKQKTKKAK
ncbi:receptor-interacting serine/threonine-protein kinase 4 isoform X2 [Acipenser ruthenus]|uniref:receptor-interacting serine/threonine-protein kinase 4 isoform X2 n=1 Tax=Acipenser ruthenus TaxID=7906 RepID=UPI00145B023D|nr:receptor-interacting serine/threonine-protein kinase 4 isoform X2 [Acipenser ruthenus]